MTELQNPFVFAASDAAAEQAAASLPSPRSPDAAADPLQASIGGTQESPAAGQELIAAGDLGLDDIGEIFAGARKLDDVLDAEYLFALDPGNQKYRGMARPRLNVAAFMLELDEAPLFLRQAV